MTKKYFFAALSCALLAASCQEEELGFTQQEVFRGAYERNFTQTFGDVDPNQSWDFSAYGRVYTNSTSEAQTRAVDPNGVTYPAYYEPIEGWADEATHTPNEYYEVPSEMLTWMNKTILASKNNTSLIGGNFSFVWQAGQVLEIVPIWQGNKSQIYSLYIVMGDKEEKQELIWKRNGGMQITEDGTNWVNVEDNGGTYKQGHTENAQGIRAKPLLITDDMLKKLLDGENPDLKELKLKLYIETGMTSNMRGNPTVGTYYSCTGDYFLSSGENYCVNHNTTGTQKRMGLLNVSDDFFNGIPSDYKKWILGCEDSAHRSASDWDYNDVVFLIAGKVADPINYEEKGTFDRKIEKRYLVEDLTGYYDFDFNDIVVDVVETYKLGYKKDNFSNVVTFDADIDENKKERKQTITIKHLCGTVPLQVKIGPVTLPRITNPVNQEQTLKELKGENVSDAKTWWEDVEHRTVGIGWEPEEATYTYTEGFPWNAASNNISVLVWTQDGSDLTNPTSWKPWEATFPKVGSIPYIIATEIGRQWMPEGTKDADAAQAWWDALTHGATYYTK